MNNTTSETPCPSTIPHLPLQFHHVIIIPIPKTGKPADLGTSFNHIFLFCPAVKVLVRLQHPELNVSPIPTIRMASDPTIHHFCPSFSHMARDFNQPLPPHRTLITMKELRQSPPLFLKWTLKVLRS